MLVCFLAPNTRETPANPNYTLTGILLVLLPSHAHIPGQMWEIQTGVTGQILRLFNVSSELNLDQAF